MGLCPFLEGCFRGVSSLALLSCCCMFEHMPTASNKASGSVACIVSVCPLACRAGCPRKGWGTDSIHHRETVTGKIATAAPRGLIGARQRAAYTPHPVPFHVPLGVRLLRAQLMAKEAEAQRQCTRGGTTRDSQTSPNVYNRQQAGPLTLVFTIEERPTRGEQSERRQLGGLARRISYCLPHASLPGRSPLSNVSRHLPLPTSKPMC